MGKRRKARELAIQCLYELEAPGKDAGLVLREQGDRRGSARETREYAGRLLAWARDGQGELDAALVAKLKNWDIERVSLVTRIIMRMTLAEARRAFDVPVGVLLDEAVELARKYDSDKAAGFVNGVLEALLREERPEEFSGGEGSA